MADNSPIPPNPRYDQEVVVHDHYQQVMTPTGPAMQDVAVTEYHDCAAARRARFRWVSGLVYFLFGVLEVLIAARFALKLLAANPDNPFVRFIYDVTAPFVAPFLTILPALSPWEGSVLELSALVAIIVYAILSWVIVKVAELIILRPGTGRTVTRVERRNG